MAWHARGTYFESCNCDAPCPCRRIDGVPGGRSTHGVCLGVLSWHIRDGRSGSVDLSDLAVALVLRYSDDEEGSPWTFVLYVDDRGDEAQRAALEQIFAGALGGSALEQFPWAWKPSDLLAAVPARIELDHTPRRQWLRIGERVLVRIRGVLETDATITCVIPGHHQAGEELVAETIAVDESPPLRFEFTGTCGYSAGFDYRG